MTVARRAVLVASRYAGSSNNATLPISWNGRKSGPEPWTGR
ncbi:MAG TPA: hypothetical protein VJ870_17365 [Amycolatopsis sp.]|nr:hypothetical protein [Amycolatopsis sp.]